MQFGELKRGSGLHGTDPKSLTPWIASALLLSWKSPGALMNNTVQYHSQDPWGCSFFSLLDHGFVVDNMKL